MSRTKRKGKRKIRPNKPRSRKPRPKKSVARSPAATWPRRPAPTSGVPSLREVMADPGLKRWRRLLTKVDKDPDAALEDPRCQKPHFLALLFDLCDGKVLEAPYVAGDYVDVATELARRSGDRHQMNLAVGVAVHALIAGKQWPQAFEALQANLRQVKGCCRVCAGDWLRRYGDLMVEAGNPSLSRAFLKLSARALGPGIDDDTRGRLLFVRGIAFFFQRKRARALDDAGRALMLVSLTSPRGYFLDAVAFLACFLEGDEHLRHHKTALAHLGDFGDRLKGLKDWNDVRDRVRWVEGLIHACLGHPHRARGRLERARKAHLGAPHRWALAIGIDHALTYCRGEEPEAYIDLILRVMKACRAELKLEPELAQRLKKFLEVVADHPWMVKDLLEELRRSFVVPVPGLLVKLEREALRKREWRYDDPGSKSTEVESIFSPATS